MKIAKLYILKHELETAVNNLLRRRNVMAILQKHDFYQSHVCPCQTSIAISPSKKLSSDVFCPFPDWGHRYGDKTVIGNRCLHLLESLETSIAAHFSFCRLEKAKLYSSREFIFFVWAWHKQADKVSDLSTGISRPSFGLTKCHFEILHA